jgi:endonuclease/exonuclease/phosphatase (EEP) superfamily protein YafD
MATAVAGLLMLTQAFGWNGVNLVATAQALTPYVLLAVVPVAGVACWANADRLAVVSSLVGVGGMIVAAPLVFAPCSPAPDPAATEVTVAAVNLLLSNPVIDEAASDLLTRNVDAIVFSEFTVEHQMTLRSSPLWSAYPYKIERDAPNAGGMALWSRYPIREGERPNTSNYTLDITMDGPDGPIRLLGVHPPTPISFFDGWVDDLATFGRLGANAQQPTLIVGDFNAAYWHPSFRDLLRHGFTDAHTARGRGFSTSWPTDEWFPAFVRLDHALTGNGLVSTDVEDFTVPGSDHRGLIVSVAPTR